MRQAIIEGDFVLVYDELERAWVLPNSKRNSKQFVRNESAARAFAMRGANLMERLKANHDYSGK